MAAPVQVPLGGAGWRDLVPAWSQLREDFERLERRLVEGARESGCSWDEVAATLDGLSRETLRRRYGGQR